jgi:hypothetical protein
MFDIARRSLGVINVISKVALKFGSSQHGNARRQSAGYTNPKSNKTKYRNFAYFELCASSISNFIPIRCGIFISIKTRHTIGNIAVKC